MSKLEMVITSRERDLGGFHVRRLLPYATHRMVGPFIFFDHIGPAELPEGQGMDVRPHPHVNLATVTYLFEGKIEHRDSLGSDQLIEPGAINWMTAGKGIVHSERTPADLRKSGSRLAGIQCWVALPNEHENIEPSFKHHPAETLPEFSVEGVKLRLLLGKAFDRESPVRVHSDLFYLEARFQEGQNLTLAGAGRESAVYVVDGTLRLEGQEIPSCSLAVMKSGEDVIMQATADSRVMLLGGAPVGKRFIFWNFVSSSEAAIEEAKREWRAGPGAPGSRFPKIPGDDREFIPLPVEPPPAKGTIL